MIIKTLSLTNWRRHESLQLEFHPLSNLLCGRGSVGKTSIIKAIAWVLGLGTRIGNERDIRIGADETEVSLTIELPSGEAAPSKSAEHTITRRLNRKGASSVRIDGEKVSVARGVEIMTLEWGLPHPEQLVGMIWLRQMRLDALIRENPAARQERFRALLGFQQLKMFSAPLDRITAQLSNAANAERARGIDPREIQTELATVEAQRTQLATQLQSFPSEETFRATDNALRGCLKRLEAAAARSAAETAVNELDPVLTPWIEAARQHLSDGTNPAAPDIARLGDYAAALQDLRNLEDALKGHQAKLANLPAQTEIETEIAALKAHISRLELATLDAALARAMANAPAELSVWFEDALRAFENPDAVGAPDLARLADYAANQQALHEAKAQLKAIGNPADLQADSIDLNRWSLRFAFDSATRVADAGEAALPPSVKDWSAKVRSTLATTRGKTREERVVLHREAGVINAATLIERNATARAAATRNLERRQLVDALDTMLGTDAPNADVRGQLLSCFRLEREIAAMATRAGVDHAACNGSGGTLRSALQLTNRAALATAIPATTELASQSLSPKAEQALRLLWSELASTHTCPLTGDEFTREGVERARIAQAEREKRAASSDHWRTFRAMALQKDREVAESIDRGDLAGAIDLVRSAHMQVEEVRKSGLAPATAPIWTSPDIQTSFFALHDQVAGLHSALLPTHRAWAETSAAASGLSPEEFLQNVRALEQRIAAHGPEIVVTETPFGVEVEAAINSQQECIVAEDIAAARLDGFIVLHGPTPAATFAAPNTLEECSTRLKDVESRLTKLPVLEAKVATTQEASQTLASKLFTTAEQAERYTLLASSLRNSTALARFAETTEVVQDLWARIRETKRVLNDAHPWNPQFGPSPDNPTTANERITQLEASLKERQVLQSNITVCEASLARARTTEERMRSTVFSNADQAAQFTDLLAVLQAEPARTAERAENARVAVGLLGAANTLEAAASHAAPWSDEFGPAPATTLMAQARISALEKELNDRAALCGKIDACDQAILRLRESLTRMEQRAKVVARTETLRERFKAVERFLQPDHGPRVIMSQEFLDIIARANEVLEMVGANTVLVGDEEFELLTTTPGQSESEAMVLAEEEGGGNGNVCGIALALGLLDHYNATSNGCGVHTLFVDEPTICVGKQIVPSLFNVLTSKGRRANQQTIIVEHEPSSNAYVNKVLHID